MYWPNIDRHKNLNPYETFLLHEIPKDVWNKVGTDLFACLNKLYLIAIDHTSQYFKLAQLPNSSSDTVITHIRGIFAQHGIPKIVFSDNGPQYSSHKFKKFSKPRDFNHKMSSHEFPE